MTFHIPMFGFMHLSFLELVIAAIIVIFIFNVLRRGGERQKRSYPAAREYPGDDLPPREGRSRYAKQTPPPPPPRSRHPGPSDEETAQMTRQLIEDLKKMDKRIDSLEVLLTDRYRKD